MGYILGNSMWSSVFAVPTEVTDKQIKMASGVAVKVLLLVLRHNGAIEDDQMAQMLGYPLEDVRDAVLYWQNVGVIDAGAEKDEQPLRLLTPGVAYREEPEASPQQQQPDTREPKLLKLSSGRQKLTRHEINEMSEQDENIAYLLQETQSALGKPMNAVADDTVVALYSYYGMQPDLILMLIHYCVSIGKDNMRYIEKTAAAWMEKGIDTHEKAEAEIVRCTRQGEDESRIKKAFGIYDRALVTSEKKYIGVWFHDYQMDLPLIQLAYERSVELKGKLSFAYINGILTNWHKKGITTPAEALREMKEKSAPKAEKVSVNAGSSYTMEELEELVNYGSIV